MIILDVGQGKGLLARVLPGSRGNSQGLTPETYKTKSDWEVNLLTRHWTRCALLLCGKLSLLPHHIFALPLPNQVVFLPKLNQIVLAPNLDLTLNLTKLWLKTYFKIPENNKITQAKVNRYSDHRLRELDVFSNFVHHFIPCIIYDFLKDLQQRSCPKTA